jgi:hypothetical protein
VLFTQGSAVIGYSNLSATLVDSLLDSATVYTANAQWHGVDINSVMPTDWSNQQQTIEGVRFPVFRPTTVHLQVDNYTMPYAFPLSGHATTTFAIGIMTIDDWNTSLRWYGYDDNGVLIRQTQTTPEVYDTPLDSGLAKVWAADNSHVAEREIDNPGGVYGFVTKAMFLRAGTEHASTDSAVGVAFLNESEIHLPVTVHTPRAELTAARQVHHSYTRGILTLAASPAFGLARIRVFSLSGRLLLEIDPEQFRIGAGRYVLPLRYLLPRLCGQAVVVSLQGRVATSSFKLLTGGVQ